MLIESSLKLSQILLIRKKNEYEKLQSNNYRILSEVYKDVEALRTLNFTEAEIRDLLSGRRALSKAESRKAAPVLN